MNGAFFSQRPPCHPGDAYNALRESAPAKLCLPGGPTGDLERGNVSALVFEINFAA
jgi:hypothetical protein